MDQWPPSTPATFGQDSRPDPVMRLVQWLRDHLIQSQTPGGDVSDPAVLAAERARVVADYARRGAAPNQVSASPMTADVLARAASRTQTQYQQGNPASTDALIADLLRQPQTLSEAPIVPTQFDQQLGPAQPPIPTPVPMAPPAPPAQTPLAQGLAVDPAELERQRQQVIADYAARTQATPAAPPAYLDQIMRGSVPPPVGPPAAVTRPMAPAPGVLSAFDLGVSPNLIAPVSALPPMPTPGVPVAMNRDPKSDLMRAVVLGVMLGAGPRSGIGTGAGQGFLGAQAAQQAEQDRLFKLKEAEALRQQTIYAEQQRAEALREADRQKQRQGALAAIKKRVSEIPDEATYQSEMDSYGRMLVSNGFRADGPNALRAMFPFIPPEHDARMVSAWKAWIGNESNKRLLEERPEIAINSQVAINVAPRGQPPMMRHFSLADVAAAAGSGFAIDPGTGQPTVVPKDAASSSEFSQKLKSLQSVFQATNNRRPTVQENDALVNEAAEYIKQIGRDPAMADLARSTAELRNEMLQLQVGQQPTRDDAAKMAAQLLEHKKAPSQLSLLGGFGASGQAFKRMILIEAQKQDPNFNLEEAEATYQLVKSPGFQQNIRYMTSVQDSMPLLLSRARTLANGNVRGLNGLINAGKNQFNNVDLKKFQTDVTLVADEVAKILQGGGTGSGTSDAKLKQASTLLSSTDSPAAIAGALDDINAMIGFRKRALTRGTYLDTQPAVDDSIKSAIEELRRRGTGR